MSETDAQATEARAAAKRAPGRPWPDGEIRQVLLAPADREVLSRLAKRLKRSIDAIDVVRRIGATSYAEQSPKQRDGKFWKQVTTVAAEIGELPPARCAPLASLAHAEAAPLEPLSLEAAPLGPLALGAAPFEPLPLEAEAFEPAPLDVAPVPIPVPEPLFLPEPAAAAPTLVDVLMHPLSPTPTEMLFAEDAAPLDAGALAVGSGPVLAEPVFPALTVAATPPPLPFAAFELERPPAGSDEVTWPGLAAALAAAEPAVAAQPPEPAALEPELEDLPLPAPPRVIVAAPFTRTAPAPMVEAAPALTEYEDETPLPAPMPLIMADLGADADEPELPPFDPSTLVPLQPFKDVTMAELTLEIDGMAPLDAGTMELRGAGELEGTLLVPSVAGMCLIGLPEGGEASLVDLDQLEIGLETSPELPPSVMSRVEAPSPVSTITVTAPYRAVTRPPAPASAEPPPDIATIPSTPRVELPELEIDLGLCRRDAPWVVARARRDKSGIITVRRAGPIRLNNDQMNAIARRFRLPACVPGLSAVPVELEPGHPDHFLAAAADLPHEVVLIGEARRPR